MDPTAEALLVNSMPADQWETPFSDRFGHFSIEFTQPQQIGLGALHPRSNVHVYRVLRPALRLWLDTGRHRLAVRRQQLTTLPWKVVEAARVVLPAGTVTVKTEHLFADERTLVSVFRFRADETIATFRPFWAGVFHHEPSDDRFYAWVNNYAGTAPVPRRPSLRARGPCIEAAWRSDPEGCGLAEVCIRIESADGLRGRVTEHPPWGLGGEEGDERSRFYDLSPSEAVTLQPGESRSYTFMTQVRMKNVHGEVDDFTSPGQIEQDPVVLEEASRAWFACQLNTATIPDGVHEEGLAPLVVRARQSLLKTGLRGLNGEFGDRVASLCSPSYEDFSCNFYWDTHFVSAALARFNADYAKDALRVSFLRQDPRDGAVPERKFNFTPPGRHRIACPQSPIAAWAVRTVHDLTGDAAFVKELYPNLSEVQRFWKDHSDADGDGLSEYNWSGQTGDDSPIWDAVRGSADEHSGCFWLPPVASVALNSFLYRDAAELERLAPLAGQADDARKWRDRQAALWTAFEQYCYVAADRRYWDYNQRTHLHHKGETFYMFLPLWAGMPVPAEVKRELIEEVLLNPAKFYGDIPFPSVAYDHPQYEAGGYWRGKAWPHFSYFMLEVLAHHGYEREADVAADRIISHLTHVRGFLENMTTDPADTEPSGFNDYNWGSAAFCLIAERCYRRQT